MLYDIYFRMKSIKNLDESTVHTIATNQVIVSLSVAVNDVGYYFI